MKSCIPPLSVALAIVGFSSIATAKGPNCSHIENWPTSMAFVHLKNDGLIDGDKIEYKKTKTTLLASEQIGQNLYRQIHLVVFTEKTGNIIEAITDNKATNEECSGSGVEVFIVAKRLGPK